MEGDGTLSPMWVLVQFGTGLTATLAGVLATAMTLPTPPWFELDLIEAVVPPSLIAAWAFGGAGLVSAVLTRDAGGPWAVLRTVSIGLAAVGFGLGVFISRLLAGAA